MPTFRETPVKCAVCGNESIHCRICSMTAIGFSDLDFRSPLPQRGLDGLALQECKNCGYVNRSIGYAPFITKEKLYALIKSEEYITPNGYSDIPFTAKKYLRYIMIRKAEGINDKLLWESYLKAAWACDDAGENEVAAKLRCKVADILNSRYHFKRRKPKKYTFHFRHGLTYGKLAVIYADVLRRSGQFRKVARQLHKINISDNRLNAALIFEIERAKERDAGRYRFDRNETFSRRLF